MPIAKIKYLRRFNLGDYQHEEFEIELAGSIEKPEETDEFLLNRAISLAEYNSTPQRLKRAQEAAAKAKAEAAAKAEEEAKKKAAAAATGQPVKPAPILAQPVQPKK